MESPIAGRSVIDIGASAARYRDGVKQLPATHPLTVYYTVSCIFGIGKVTALEVLNIGMTLNSLGHHEADMDNAVSETTSCNAACYGTRIKCDIGPTIGPVHNCSGSRSSPVRVAFTPGQIDWNGSGFGPVTRSHLFRNATGTSSPVNTPHPTSHPRTPGV